jgi:hypothetical protein
MHQNDVFLFFKNYFWDQCIKMIQNIAKKINFLQKKNLNFLETRPTFPNTPLIAGDYLNLLRSTPNWSKAWILFILIPGTYSIVRIYIQMNK